MNHQYAASYSSSKDAERPLSRLYALLGTFMKHVKGSPGRRKSLASVVRRRLLSVPTALVLLWIWVLYWGERTTFRQHVEACDWETWEQWPTQAQPHRLVLVADPQLVDPHTYPGRPWPLSALTVAFTDKYLKRSYRLLHRSLDPDTVFFLGDLFDGGREWATQAREFESSEKRWKSYGELFWINEFNRFGDIFFSPDQTSGGLPVMKVKRTFPSLPGNHDLGFGSGIQKSVRDRFRAYFGESDRVDVVGNHTFVSLDTVSLSAMGQPDADETLWNGTLQFLDQARHLKTEAVKQTLGFQKETTTLPKYSHEVMQPEDLDRRSKSKDGKQEGKPELPTIVLTHVPLYREPGTPCGPLRERHPPSVPKVEHDDANAIRVAAGYQYQNVLTRDISNLIAEKVHNVGYVFSGDDHDYCQVVHESYPSAGSGIVETTVKSISWAMGVRRPGFVMVSLWNPIDDHGKSLYDIQGGQKAGDPTLQSHLCLLPDQLGIFIRYAICAVISLAVLCGLSVSEAKRGGADRGKEDTLLPVSEPKEKEKEAEKERAWDRKRARAASGSLNSASPSDCGNNLSARSKNARTRSVSPMTVAIGDHGYSLPRFHRPLIEQAGYYGSKNFEIQEGETDDWGNPPMKVKPKKPKKFRERLVERFATNLGLAGGPIMLYYWWLLRNG